MNIPLEYSIMKSLPWIAHPQAIAPKNLEISKEFPSFELESYFKPGFSP